MTRVSTKTREVIWGGRIMGADMRAQAARQEATKAARAADRAYIGYFDLIIRRPL